MGVATWGCAQLYTTHHNWSMHTTGFADQLYP